MSKYKAGDKVRVVANERGFCPWKQAMTGKICEVRDYCADGYYTVWEEDRSDFWYFNESDLQPAKRTLRDMQVGDVVVDKNSKYPWTVQLVLPDGFIHFSQMNNAGASIVQFSYAEERGWKLKDTEPETIEVNGKKYNAEAVRERLSELEEVE